MLFLGEDKISGISVSFGNNENIAPITPLNPVEVYNNTRPSDWLTMPTPEDNEIYLLFHIPDGASSLLAFSVSCTGNYVVELGTVSDGNFVQLSSTTVQSGKTYEAELFADDYGNITTTGKRQVMIKISGTAISQWIPKTHSKKKRPSNFAQWNIVEVACRLSNGNKFQVGNNSGNTALRYIQYFSWYGENKLTSMSNMFSNCKSLMSILSLNTQNVTRCDSCFNGCSSLIAIPQLNTSSITNMSNMFNGCRSIACIPEMDTTNVTNMSQTFLGCYSLVKIPTMNTQNVTNMSKMFSDCFSVTSIPALNTKAVTNMNRMFAGCYSLTSIESLDTSSVIDIGYLFYNCCSLVSIPEMDTRNVVTMQGTFSKCFSLKTIPNMNTKKVTNMSSMFNECGSLINIPAMDTNLVTDMSYMFNGCYSLTSIPQMDTQLVTSMSNMFIYCYCLTSIPMLNTTKVTNMTNAFSSCFALSSVLLDASISDWAGCSFSLGDCSLPYASIIALFNSLPTITSTATITLTGNPGASELTDADKLIATEKGWTLTL